MNSQAKSAIQAGIAAIHAATDPNSEINTARRITRQIKARTARREKIIGFASEDGNWPLLAYLMGDEARGFISIDNAHVWLRNELRRIASVKANGHWSYRDLAQRIPSLRERLIVATFFARHGAEIWAQEAA